MGLENRRSGNTSLGSNPSLSANSLANAEVSDTRTTRCSCAVPTVTDGALVGTFNALADAAFYGRLVYLQECANALDFTNEAPVMAGRKRPSLYTYFIGAETGPIKIGTARDPYERLLTLQVGHPDELYVYALTDGGRHTERKLHSEFSSERTRGEWFQRSPRILRRILLLQQAEIDRLKSEQRS